MPYLLRPGLSACDLLIQMGRNAVRSVPLVSNLSWDLMNLMPRDGNPVVRVVRG